MPLFHYSYTYFLFKNRVTRPLQIAAEPPPVCEPPPPVCEPPPPPVSEPRPPPVCRRRRPFAAAAALHLSRFTASHSPLLEGAVWTVGPT